MSKTSAIIPTDNPDQFINLVLDGLSSDHSKRVYRIALEGFLTWYTGQNKPGLSKATVQRYKAVLEAKGLASSSINQKLSAIRKLAVEAADNGLLNQTLANGILRVKGVHSRGVRVGNWLTREQAQALLSSPDLSLLKGYRDRAILAVLIGGGLRRAEVAELTLDNIQMRENRWIICDLIGKGNKIRSIPIPSWVKTAIDEWVLRAKITDGKVFRRVNKGDNLMGEGLTPQAIRDIVVYYSEKIGCPVAAHDLRRTFAKLAHRGGSAIDQIQLSLSHSSIQTTERYLGVKQDLCNAPCDYLGLKI